MNTKYYFYWFYYFSSGKIPLRQGVPLV